MSMGKIISTLWDNVDLLNLPDSVLDDLCCASEISARIGDMATVVDGLGCLVGTDDQAGNFHDDKDGLTSLLFFMGDILRTASAATFVASEAASIRHFRSQGHVGSTNSDEDRRQAGAMNGLNGLRRMIKASENEPNDVLDCLTKRYQDVQQLVAGFGPLTPEQEGAVATLVEYIQFSTTTGEPDLDHWTSNAAMTRAEFDAYVQELEAGDKA